MRGRSVHIKAVDFNVWLDSIAPGANLSQVSRRSAMSLSTLSTQRSHDRIPPKSILAIARSYGKNPVKELSQFEGFEFLTVRPASLTSLVPLYSALDLLHEQFVREGRAIRNEKPLLVPSDALKRWVNEIRGVMTQKELASNLEVQQGNFSRELSTGDMSFMRVVEIGNVLGVNPVVGLVASGELSFDDVFGCSMLQYLEQVSDESLLEALFRAQNFLTTDLKALVS